MTVYTLPRANAPIAGDDPPATQWYNYLLYLDERTSSISGDVQIEISTIATKLGSPDGTVSNIPPLGNVTSVQGLKSISSSGLSYVQLTLVNDLQVVSPVYFYGTDSTGLKGWNLLYDGFSDSPTIKKINTSGIVSFDLINLTATALTDLTYPNVVALDGMGNAYYPDLTVPDDVSRIIGVTLHAALAGAPVEIVTSRDFTEVSWSWLPGRIYCSVTGGALTQTVPVTGAVVEVARVVAPTSIRVGIQPAILRA